MERARDDATVMEEGDDLLHEEEGGGGGYGGQLEACDVLLSLACGTLHEEEAVPRRQGRRGRRAAFECRTCGRRFASFQALGGHRTSHLRAGKTRPSKSKAVVHACGVCGLAFSMGQALGGHMRRHRATTTDAVGAPDLKQIMVQQSCRPLQLLDLFL